MKRNMSTDTHGRTEGRVSWRAGEWPHIQHRKIMLFYGAQNTNEDAVNVYNCVENIVKLSPNKYKRYEWYLPCSVHEETI